MTISLLSAITFAVAKTVIGLVPGAPSLTTANCESVAACVFVTNSGSGEAIDATSNDTYGVVGRTHSMSSTTLEAGVLGVGPLYGMVASGAVLGLYATGNAAVYGSGGQVGVYGEASRAAGKNAGVEGSGPAGVVGVSYYGPSPGVEGINFGTGGDTYGVEGQNLGYVGVHGQGKIGVIATAINYAQTALQLETGGNAAAFIAIASDGKPYASLDGSGNLMLEGGLTQHGTPLGTVAATNGSTYVAYGERSAQASIEDVGEAQLTHGRAVVALDPAFASTIDSARPYLVFVTPEGDSNGLFVEARAPRGFTVCENRAGTSSVRFQYRIVASPADGPRERLPLAVPLAARLHGLSGPHVTHEDFKPPASPPRP